MIYMKNYQLFFTLDKSTKSIHRINYFGKVDKIGKAYPGETPGRTFRKWEKLNRLFILTRYNKISSFDIVSHENMTRSGSILLPSNLIITDYKPIGKKRILIGTNNYSIWLYNLKKDMKSELITGVEFTPQPDLSEIVSTLGYNSTSKQILVFLKESQKSSPTRMFLLDLQGQREMILRDEFWINFSDEMESACMNLNFDLSFSSNKQIMVFYDNGGTYKMNVFLVEGGQLNQFFEVVGFHSGVSFVNQLEGRKLFSLDFNGLMKVLSIEN